MKISKTMFLLMALLLSTSIFSKEQVISIGLDLFKALPMSAQKGISTLSVEKDSVVLKIEEKLIPVIHHLSHSKFNRCAGYFFHENELAAKNHMELMNSSNDSKEMNLFDYSISENKTVNELIDKVDDIEILKTITHLASFHNRYYTATTGVEAAEWIKGKWSEMSASRSDISVEFFNHRSWGQKSVIATIKGSSDDKKIVVLGGHLDSISGYWSPAGSRAPGADDNASGIATLTEILRVIVDTGFVPKKTIKIMGYAAEEVGLRGSQEIAKRHFDEKQDIIGVLQLDMVNFNGSSDIDVALVTDYTNREQNTFIAELIDTYVKVPWGYTECGYACSDHASWHKFKFPASIPFEAKMDDMNHQIHTAKDVLAFSGNETTHAAKFARIGIAYAVEMTK